jgi:hypothetical protein
MEDIHVLFEKYTKKSPSKKVSCGKTKLDIGDTVKIRDAGLTYSSYEEMAKKMEAKYWIRGCADDGMVGVIVATAKHDNGYNNLYLVRVKDFPGHLRDFIIGEDGLEVV